MKAELLELLVCPKSGQKLMALDLTYDKSGEIESGWLVTQDKAYRYPIKNKIPRFVTESNYTDNFGYQWNKFPLTQLDSYSGHPISSDRFFKATGWLPEDLKDQWVLDVGCGAGRFAEVALMAGAKVIAFDYSNAVNACLSNIGHHPNLHIVQADIYEMPFLKDFFSYIYSLGVLQHTPDVKKSFFSLLPFLADEGNLCVDFYKKSWKSWLHLKYWLRPLTKRCSSKSLFEVLEKYVPRALSVSIHLASIPVLGRYLQRLIPVANYNGILPLDKKQQFEWSLLDTFDWFSPTYDNPQTPDCIKTWFEEAGLINIHILHAGHLVGRGKLKAML